MQTTRTLFTAGPANKAHRKMPKGLLVFWMAACVLVHAAPGGREALVSYQFQWGGFTVGLPENWERQEQDGGRGTWMVSASSPKESPTDTFAENVNIVVVPADTADLKVAKNTGINTLRRHLAQFSLEAEGLGRMGANDVAWFIHTAEFQGQMLKVGKYMIIVGGKMCIVTCSALPETFDRYKRVFEQIVSSITRAAEAGQLTAKQDRQMTSEQRRAMEKQMKEHQAPMAKNKALNDAFNAGMDALKTKQFDAAVQSFVKASEMDPKQHVVWAQMAAAYLGLAHTKTGAGQKAAMNEGLRAYGKAMELKPDEAGYHNNYALALAMAKRFPEAQAEWIKAAQIDPPNAGRYYYNLGAVLVNTGQSSQWDRSGEAFQKAIVADPNFGPAHYQYGLYLLSKGQVTSVGAGIFAVPPGTREAFEKYLQLRPNGEEAESARAILVSLKSVPQTVTVHKTTDPTADPYPFAGRLGRMTGTIIGALLVIKMLLRERVGK